MWWHLKLSFFVFFCIYILFYFCVYYENYDYYYFILFYFQFIKSIFMIITDNEKFVTRFSSFFVFPDSWLLCVSTFVFSFFLTPKNKIINKMQWNTLTYVADNYYVPPQKIPWLLLRLIIISYYYYYYYNYYICFVIDYSVCIMCVNVWK